jgi:uroporphyrinogen-III synthase
VLIPRPSGQAGRTAKAIRERGGEPTVLPLIEIVPPPDPGALAAALAELGAYEWVLFTSENGVGRTFEALAWWRQTLDAHSFPMPAWSGHS